MTNGISLPRKNTTLTSELKKIGKKIENTRFLLDRLQSKIDGKPIKNYSKKSNNPINKSGAIGQKLTEQKLNSLSSFVYRSQYQYKFVGKEQIALAKKSSRIDLLVTSLFTGNTIHLEVKHQDVAGTASKSVYEIVRTHKCIKKHVLVVVSGKFYSDASIAALNDSFVANDDKENEFAYIVHLDNLEKALSYWERQDKTNLIELATFMKI